MNTAVTNILTSHWNDNMVGGRIFESELNISVEYQLVKYHFVIYVRCVNQKERYFESWLVNTAFYYNILEEECLEVWQSLSINPEWQFPEDSQECKLDALEEALKILNNPKQWKLRKSLAKV